MPGRPPSDGDCALGNVVGWVVFFAALFAIEGTFVLDPHVYRHGSFGCLGAK
jgi:hypothetical protein